MNGSRHLLANGAIALLMSSASAFAMPSKPAQPQLNPASRAAIVLAQAECPEGSDCAPDAQAEPSQENAEQPRRRREAQPEPQAEQPAEPQPEAQPEPQAEQPAEPQPEAQPEPQAEQPAEPQPEAQPEPQAEQPAEPQPEAQPEPQAEQPAEPQPEAQPEPEAEQPAEPQPEARPEPQAEQPAQPQPEAQPEPQPDRPARQPDAAPAEPAPPQPEAQPEPQPDAQQPQGTAPENQAPAPDAPAQSGEAAPNDGARAPMLDSQKPAPAGQGGRRQRPADQAAQPPAQPPGPPPADDRAAQQDAQPKEIVPVTQEKGQRRAERPAAEQRERPEGTEVLRTLGDRIILRFDNQTIVESDDRERMGRGARDVYYEDLPRGRTREVVLRENGVQVVTIRDRNGDIIRRSRITPDGREYVLNYVDEENFDRVREWRDPGYDLPPMRLDIPEDEYIFNAERAEDWDDYYDFLSEPPVERVERLYSVDEVRRSARIRDKTRRIDLDTITFEFGRADVPETQVRKLEGVAQAMEKLLDRNPAESFLIEGHTDAVGTDVANLALSDRRAEAVADALTNVFGIPPENLVTQGYGEQYLKVRTQEPERENRRVAIRRITPLVAPVASAN